MSSTETLAPETPPAEGKGASRRFSVAGVVESGGALIVLYAVMTVGAVAVLRSMAIRWRSGETADLPTPYGPHHAPPRGSTP